MKKIKYIATLLSVVMVASIFSACGGSSSPTATTTTTSDTSSSDTSAQEEPAEEGDKGMTVSDTSVKSAADAGLDASITLTQSPFLDNKGLPPVEERMPKNPKVWNSIPEKQMKFEIGKYGGTLNTIRMDPVWDAVMWTAAEETLINSPGRLGEEFTPNILESYEINDEMTEFTFKLREGMKWSDGVPVTTEDARFAFEDFICNTDLNPTTSAWFRAGGSAQGEVAKFEIIDDYTFKFTYASAYGGNVLHMAFCSYTDYLLPAHFLKDYHAKYADPDDLKAKLKEWGYMEDEWFTLFKFMRTDAWNTGRKSQMVGMCPTLAPWVQVKDSEPRIYERNPYYWKIDPSGQQLPYVDVVESTYVSDIEAASIKILAGEIDCSYEWIPLNQIPLYKENEERGGYRILTNTLLHRTDADILLNQTHKDPAWRSVVRDVRFRKALSLAMDRQELLDAVYYGFAKISDIQDPTHDIDAANALLDEMGMEYGPDGYRNAPDGSPLYIDFTYSGTFAQYASTAQLVNENWRDLGLRINFKQAEGSMVDNMADANEAQISIGFQHGPVTAMFDDWRFNASGRLWNLYYTTGGAEGEEMPEAVKHFYDTVYGIRVINPADIGDARKEMRRSIAENYWSLIPVEDVTQVTLINKDLKNFPDAGYMISNCWAAAGWWFDR